MCVCILFTYQVDSHAPFHSVSQGLWLFGKDLDHNKGSYTSSEVFALQLHGFLPGACLALYCVSRLSHSEGIETV